MQINADPLSQIAAKHWSAEALAAPDAKPAFDPAIVMRIYNEELGGAGSKPPGLRRVMMLEISQYLENYLWPNFDAATASPQHVVSILLMINEKFRENVPAWACFSTRPVRCVWLLSRRTDCGNNMTALPLLLCALCRLGTVFKNAHVHTCTLLLTLSSSVYKRCFVPACQQEAVPGLFERFVRLRADPEHALKPQERVVHLLFAIHAFQSLESEHVRAQALPLVGLGLWHALSPGRRMLELHSQPYMAKRWRHDQKKVGCYGCTIAALLAA